MATILVVDENPVERRVMRMTLEVDGHRVAEAPSSSDALEFLRQHAFDLVLVAMEGSDLDGYELIPHAQAVPGRETTQFVAVLEPHDEKGPVESFMAGAIDLLIRPFGAAELRDIVERVTSEEHIDLRQRLVGAQLEAYEMAVRLQEQARHR